MRKKQLYFILATIISGLLAGIIFSCVSTPQDISASLGPLLSKKNLELINEAVCEVVVEKPEEDSLSYEKDITEYLKLLPL